MLKFTVRMAAVSHLVIKYRFVNDSKIKIWNILPMYVLTAVSFQEKKRNKNQPTKQNPKSK